MISRKKGIALVSIMLIALMLIFLATAITGLSTAQTRYSLKRTQEIISRQTALAGLNEALSFIRPRGGVGDLSGLLTELLSGDYTRAPALSGGHLTYEKRHSGNDCYYQVDLSVDVSSGLGVVESRGYFKDGRGAPQWPKKVKVNMAVQQSQGGIRIAGSGNFISNDSTFEGNILVDCIGSRDLLFTNPAGTGKLRINKGDAGRVLSTQNPSGSIAVEQTDDTITLTAPPEEASAYGDSSMNPSFSNTTINAPIHGSTVHINGTTVNAPIKAHRVYIDNNSTINSTITAYELVMHDSRVKGSINAHLLDITRSDIIGTTTGWQNMVFNQSTITDPQKAGNGDIVPGDDSGTGHPAAVNPLKIISWQEE